MKSFPSAMQIISNSAVNLDRKSRIKFGSFPSNFRSVNVSSRFFISLINLVVDEILHV